jgi:hypothetical protein
MHPDTLPFKLVRAGGLEFLIFHTNCAFLLLFCIHRVLISLPVPIQFVALIPTLIFKTSGFIIFLFTKKWPTWHISFSVHWVPTPINFCFGLIIMCFFQKIIFDPFFVGSCLILTSRFNHFAIGRKHAHVFWFSYMTSASKENSSELIFCFFNLVLQCTIEHGFKDHRTNLRIRGKNSIQLN